MPGHERPVTAEHDTIDADLVEQEAQRLLAADHGVVVEPALVAAGRPGDGATRLRRALPAAVDAAHREAGGAAAVGDAHLEIRTRVEHAAEDQARDEDRVPDEDAEAVGEAVAGPPLPPKVVSRLGGGGEDRPECFGRPG